jgi:hypothetical protein
MDDKMDYGKLLSRAFEVTRKYRALWLFGALAALFGGGSSFSGGNFGGGSGGNPSGGVMPDLPQSFWQNLAIIIAVVICVLLILWVLGVILRFISRAALIGSVQELEANGTTPTVRRGFAIGQDNFWRLLGIALVVNIPLSIISFVVILVAVLPMLGSLLPLIQAGNHPPDELIGVAMTGIFGSFFLICCAVIVLVVVQLILTPLYEFFMRACVIGKRGVMDSLCEGYRIVRTNLSQVAVLFILMIGIGIGFAILMIPVALILLGIPVGLGVAVGAAMNSATPGIIVGLILGIPMLLVLIFVSGLYETFRSTVWTEGYLALIAPKVVATTAP